jgi:XTP/dITP diphosphohydrolase
VYNTVGCSGILRLLAGSRDRRAEFVTVVGGFAKGKEFTLEGRSKGAITMSQKGSFGFGYDPIFMPEGETRTYAEMPTDQKNAISHRGRAIAAFIDWYRSQ